MALQFLQVLPSSLVPFSIFRPRRNGKTKLGSNKPNNLGRRNFFHTERPAWETQIAKLDGKAELVVNPAMLADKMKIIAVLILEILCGEYRILRRRAAKVSL
jgi:hypothetical protein